MRQSDYINYFAALAANHKDIGHTPTEMHFARVITTPDPIFKGMYLDEFLTAIKTKIRFPFMLLETYDFKYTDNQSDNVYRVQNCAFVILDKPKHKDMNDIQAKLQSTQTIGEQLLGYIYKDKMKGSWSQSVIRRDDIDGEPVGPITTDQFFGTRFNLVIQVAANQDLAYIPAKFNTPL